MTAYAKRKLIILLVISVVLFIAAQILMGLYNPYGSYPRPVGFDVFDEWYAQDNPLMRYITTELFSMVEMFSATNGIMDAMPSEKRALGVFTYLVFVTLCQVWVLIEQALFEDVGKGGKFLANAAAEIAHYLLNVAVFYAISVACLNFPRLLSWLLGDGLSLKHIIGIILFVIALILCLPSTIGFLINWLGYCISLLIIFKLLGLMVPIGLVRGAATLTAIARTPIVLITLVVVFAFDRLWTKYCKPLCYFLVLSWLQ
ncbi:MAG: hypothetical protein GX061_04210 [Eubacteriaceae bacterium]|nr:hypothetical protein [Eubacteriaceae bacterium]